MLHSSYKSLSCQGTSSTCGEIIDPSEVNDSASSFKSRPVKIARYVALTIDRDLRLKHLKYMPKQRRKMKTIRQFLPEH